MIYITGNSIVLSGGLPATIQTAPTTRSTTTKTVECDNEIRAVTSPVTGLASIKLTISDSGETHSVRLPRGTYMYDIMRRNENCSTTVRVYGECALIYNT